MKYYSTRAVAGYSTVLYCLYPVHCITVDL